MGASGTAGRGGTATCVVASTDTACDGLDEGCQPTLVDSGCPAACKATRFSGVPYMGCTVSATFADAEILCEQQHMHLVQIDSASENNFVVQIAETLGSYVWIGGSDLRALGTFSWVSGPAFFEAGAPILGVYQNFAPGEPSPTVGLDCVHLHDDPTGPWSTTHCSDAKQFICR